MVLSKQFIYRKRPEGEVGPDHYELVQTEIPDPGQGELLIRAKFLSVDPYMRIQQSSKDTWEKPHPLNTVQGGGSVGEIIKLGPGISGLAVGDFVSAYTGWTEYAVVHMSQVSRLDPSVFGAHLSTALGVLGMPGRTAFFGLTDLGRPRPGDTVVVSGAAGAVGSIVVQLARLAGARVVGIAGSEEKCAHVVSSLGAHACVSYRLPEAEFAKALEAAAPGGIDVYFDNVGGAVTDAVMARLALRARVVICGQISQYNGGLDAPEMGPRFLHHVLYKRAVISGVLARDYAHRIPEQLRALGPLVAEGKLRADETVMEGFESLPSALNALFHSKNTGKMIVKLY